MVEHALDFLFTRSSVPATKPLTHETVKLLCEADDISFYYECGWYCATGFDKNKNVTVMVHANSFEEIKIACGFSPPQSYLC